VFYTVALLALQCAGTDPQFLFAYTATPKYTPGAWVQGQDRFPEGAQIRLSDGRGVEGFTFSADPDVSPEASRILFVARASTAAKLGIWEAGIDSLAPKLLFECEEDCMRPMYLGQDLIVFSARLKGRFLVEVFDRSAGAFRRITFSSYSQIATGVLQDGRILIDSARPEGRFPMTVFPDGTGVAATATGLDATGDNHDAREMRQGQIVYLSNSCLRALPSADASAVRFPGAICGIGSPASQTREGWIVVDQQISGTNKYRIAVVRPNGTLQYFANHSGLAAVQPSVFVPRTTPKAFPSGLTQVLRQAHILVLPDPLRKDRGPEGKLRVIAANGTASEVSLGEVAFERDGSSFVEVPANTPIRFEIIAEDGSIAKRQQHWIWLRDGERRRCVGCHASPTVVPPNLRPEALAKGFAPVRLLRQP
jgi:hypothetical protein